MSGPRGKSGLPLLVAAILLVLPAAASAATLCVGTSGGSCTTVEPSLSAAMLAAQSGDTVQIGPGTYTATSGPDGVVSTRAHITLVGAGPGGSGGTTISGTSASDFNLSLSGTGSQASNLEVLIPSGASGNTGVDVNGTVTNVSVVAASNTSSVEGVIMGNGSSFSGTVNLAAATGSTVGIQTGASTVSDAIVTGAAVGIQAGVGSGTTTTIDDTRITGSTTQDIEMAGGGTLNVTSSLLQLGSPCNAACAGVYVTTDNNDSGETDLVHLNQDTLVAGSTSGGAAAGWAVIVGAEESNESATAEIDSSVGVGFPTDTGSNGGDVECYEGNGGAGAVSIGYSSFDFAGMTGSGGSITRSGCPTPTFTLNENQGGSSPVVPVFVNAAAGDYNLPYNSPLVDAGDPALTGGLDLAGHPRVVNGKGSSGAAVTDIGAYEYQRFTPALTASVPATAYVGVPIAFISAAADSNDGESLSSSVWSFDDGTTATGALTTSATDVTHTYETLGTHHTTITVTEPNGLSASKTFTTVVTALPSAASTPPAISALAFIRARTSGKGKHRHTTPASIDLRLSESATVTVVLDRFVPGRRHGGTCVAATHARRHLPKCTRELAAGTIAEALPAGATALALRKKLPSGSYQAAITARASSGQTKTVYLKFRVGKP